MKRINEDRSLEVLIALTLAILSILPGFTFIFAFAGVFLAIIAATLGIIALQSHKYHRLAQIAVVIALGSGIIQAMILLFLVTAHPLN